MAEARGPGIRSPLGLGLVPHTTSWFPVIPVYYPSRQGGRGANWWAQRRAKRREERGVVCRSWLLQRGGGKHPNHIRGRLMNKDGAHRSMQSSSLAWAVCSPYPVLVRMYVLP